MNQLVWGVDLVEEQFLASAGIPSRPYLAKRPDKFVAENSVNAKKTGILKDVDFIEVIFLQKRPEVFANLVRFEVKRSVDKSQIGDTKTPQACQ